MNLTDNDCSDMTEFQSNLLYNEPLSGYTSWCAGGLASQPYQPENSADEMGSPKYANFIINPQVSATTTDIGALIHLVQTKVREQTTIELMREVHIIGVR